MEDMDAVEDKTVEDLAPRRSARPAAGAGGTPEAALRRRSALYEYAESIAIALVLALVLRHFVVQAFKIPTGSMQPTLEIGDHLLVAKFLYGTRIPFTSWTVLPVREPRRGDIIVFKYPDRPKDDYIKRIIGVPGDKVDVRQRRILINDEPIDDPWGYCLEGDRYVRVTEPGQHCPPTVQGVNAGPFVVPADRYFVMGDNRDNSKDSRFWGIPTVPREYIKGKAWVIYWSWTDWTSWPRWERFFMLVR